MKHFLICISILFLSLYLGQITTAQVKVKKPVRSQRKITQEQKDQQLAFEYYRKQEYSKALPLFSRLYRKKNNSYYYTYYLYSLLALENYETAEKLIKQQIKKHPRELKYGIDMGYLYTVLDRPEKAKKQYDDILTQLPADKKAIRSLANTFSSRREMDYALQTYIKGRKKLNDKNLFHLEIGNLYARNGQYEQMMDEYIALLKSNPDNCNTLQMRLQRLLNDDAEGEYSKLIRTELLRANQKNPDNPAIAEMLIWYSIQQKEFSMAYRQARALDKRNREEGTRLFDLASLLMENQEYKLAGETYQYLIQKGEHSLYYFESRILIHEARLRELENDLDAQVADFHQLNKAINNTLMDLGTQAETLPLIQHQAHLLAFRLGSYQPAIHLLNQALKTEQARPLDRGKLKLELADILLLSGDQWEATLLYSQVEKAFKNEPIGHEARFRNARLSYFIGEFGWAKVQLDVLKAATSKLIANDAMELALLIAENEEADTNLTALHLLAHADLLQFRGQDSLAMHYLDSINRLSAWHPLGDDVLYKKAGILLQQKQFLRADSLLSKLLERFPGELLADNALMQLAELQQTHFNNPEKAMDYYRQVFIHYPASLFAKEARNQFRNLRGDKLN